jgi:hypothetical protein
LRSQAKKNSVGLSRDINALSIGYEISLRRMRAYAVELSCLSVAAGL